MSLPAQDLSAASVIIAESITQIIFATPAVGAGPSIPFALSNEGLGCIGIGGAVGSVGKTLVWDPFATEELIESVISNFPARSLLRIKNGTQLLFRPWPFEGAPPLAHNARPSEDDW